MDDGTGDRWLLDYPESEQHGGGSPRLRKLSGR
ncbi:MAG: Imm27 family immunity protein [Gammaproteobacteria bacterium]